MRKRLGLVLGIVGVITLSIGISDGIVKGETSMGDQTRVVTVEEQNSHEKRVPIDIATVITAEEQTMVESSSIVEGFVPQENGIGFYFKKK
ncbi:hypothetical protein [Guptibacillus algicola]|uniref:hypothetical protein n=1 Tax=Guptibacillus algicola TaxID=225844 RepID=UPI001CD3945F|nr:hypothetical protein [Alkalihalobacillus algicola]MCA0987252.1 hypothetical protein [Alkalihalobacillus algicola]